MAYKIPNFRFYPRTLTDTESLDESTTDSHEIPRDRLISMMSLDCVMKIANSGGTAHTMTRRQLWSIFDNVTLKVNGTVGNVNIEGGRYYDLLLSIFKGAIPYVNDNETPLDDGEEISIAASTSETLRFSIPFFFRADVTNEYDVSSLLDARGLSSLELEYTTGAGFLPADASLTITGADSLTKITLKEIYTDANTLAAMNKANGFSRYYNVYYTQQRDLALTTSTSLALNHDMQTGFIIQHMGVHSYDATAADWVNDIVDRYKIVHSGTEIGDVVYEDLVWESAQAEDKNDDSRSYAGQEGYVFVDFETKLGRLDARSEAGVKNGDLKIFYNTGGTFASGDFMDLIYKCLLPV